MSLKKSEYRKKFIDQFNLAKHLLADQGLVEWSDYDYQLFTFKNAGVSLIFYPHKTSSYNYHVRVRNHNSMDTAEAERIMRMLDEGAGYNCTFSRKH